MREGWGRSSMHPPANSSFPFPEYDMRCPNNPLPALDDYCNLNHAFFPVSPAHNMCLEFEGIYLQFFDLLCQQQQQQLPINPCDLIHNPHGSGNEADFLLLAPNMSLDEASHKEGQDNGGRMDRVGKKIVRSSKKDRHSKINTVNGPRDRRMRLSLDVAKKFFHLQDLLGYDKASRTVDWLLKNSGAAIRDLSKGCRAAFEEDEDDAASCELPKLPSSKKPQRKASGAAAIRVARTVGRESRRKARERARERASQKRRLRRETNCTSDQPKLLFDAETSTAAARLKESPISSGGIMWCGGSSADDARATAEDGPWSRTTTAAIYGCPNSTTARFQHQHDENSLWNSFRFAGSQQAGKSTPQLE